MQPVSEIASGGEISRLMLAIKSMMVSNQIYLRLFLMKLTLESPVILPDAWERS